VPAADFRVAPNLAPFSVTVVETPGCPDSSHCAVAPSMCPPGCPSGCIFRLFRRWSFESPRFSHPSAVPCSGAPGCPGSSLYQCRLPIQASGRPASCIFRLPAMDHRVSPKSHPFSGTAACAPGCPFAPARIASQCPPRVAPVPASSGCALSDFCGLPRFFIPLAPPTGGVPSRLGRCTVRLASGWGSGLPRISIPTGSAASASPGFPGPASAAGR